MLSPTMSCRAYASSSSVRAKRIISKVSYLYSSYPQICVKEFGSCGVEKKSMAESISNSQLRYMGRPSHNKSPKTKIIISNLSPSQRNYELPFAPYTNSHFSTFSYNENGLVRRFGKKMLDLKRASVIYYHKYVKRVIKLV
ncbi:hypothetical protein YC2023_031033 [Brassica napus]